jgi:iron(III) transport system substrate-binding protein
MQLRSITCILRATFFALALFAVPARAQDKPPAWDALVAAAEKEGALAIAGPSGRAWREELQRFEKSYPAIKLSITALAGRDFWPRLLKEREAGQYLWDLRIGGADALSYRLLHMGVFAPSRPLLMLPDLLEDKTWLGGLDGIFLDNAHRFIIGFAVYETQAIYYNQRLLPDAAGLPLETLNEPRYAGKLSMADPRGGASLNTLSVLDRAYGDGFVETLMVRQKPVITREPRQQIDWLASGRYPIAFGLPSIAFVEYAQRGGSTADFAPARGARAWSAGVGGIHFIEQAPHPAAAKLFVNWLLSRDVQATLMQAVKLNSRRTDVPLGAPETALDPKALGDYVGTMDEAIQPYEERTVGILHRVLK